MLEVEGPTSADAGVASCLLVNAEPVFRRLRDDLFDGKIFNGMIRQGGNDLQRAPWKISRKLRSFRGAGSQLELYDRKANWNNRTGPQRQGWGGHNRHENATRIFKSKRLLATAT